MPENASLPKPSKLDTYFTRVVDDTEPPPLPEVKFDSVIALLGKAPPNQKKHTDATVKQVKMWRRVKDFPSLLEDNRRTGFLPFLPVDYAPKQ